MSSGIQPLEYNILVKPREVEETTKGGIILPDSSQTADKVSQTYGTLVAMSPMAFVNPDWPEGAELPQVGDVISYAKYAGASSKIKGADGVDYIIIKDKEATAIIKESE